MSKDLQDLLVTCPPGRTHWRDYEDICVKILEHLFVPPLGNVRLQSETKTRLHKRDILIRVPYSVQGFWQYVKYRFNCESVIAECKNYGHPIAPNSVVITSKYFGKQRLGTFGMILCRKGPSVSAMKEIERMWKKEETLLLCLSDIDTLKMLSLKGQGHDPTSWIEQRLHAFLEGLE